MKTKYIVLLTLIIGVISWSYYQLFYESEIIDADYITLDKVFAEHNDEVWSVNFSPNDSSTPLYRWADASTLVT